MATTAPSWLPAWPSGWPDIEPVYRDLVERIFGPDVYDDDAPEKDDQRALGSVLSWIGQAEQWIHRRIYPSRDSGNLFTALWEEALGIPQGPAAARNDRVLAAFRHRGTGTRELIQAIFAPVFGTTDLADISFVAPDPGAHPAGASDYDKIDLQNQIHIYSTNEDLDPDHGWGRDLIKKSKPTWERWTIGRYQTAQYDVDGKGYDEATYAA